MYVTVYYTGLINEIINTSTYIGLYIKPRNQACLNWPFTTFKKADRREMNVMWLGFSGYV
jgi:hypothetical protein